MFIDIKKEASNQLVKLQFLVLSSKLSLLILSLLMFLSCMEKKNPTRTFDFFYDVSITDIPEDAKRLDIWIPVPQSDSYQQISDMKVESHYPYSIHTEKVFGNKMIYIEAEEDLPEMLNIRLSFKAIRQMRPHLEKDYRASFYEGKGALKKYLRPNKLVPTDGIIKEQTAKVISEKMTNYEKVRAIYDYVTNTLSYDKSGTGWGHGDAIHACYTRKGNCSDFHSLFIGMVRATAIPARFVIGFPLPDEATEGEIPGYHCWAEFYIKGKGWIPVDSSEAHKHPEKHDFFFGALDANRVKFTIGRDIQLQPPKTSESLNYFIYPHVLLDDNPYASVKTRFSFKE